MLQTLRRFLLGLPFFLCACADDGTCKIASVGDLQVLNSRGSPIVKASVNGHPVAFIVDSGAQFSSIWPNQVDKLGLVSQFRQVRMHGVGGETMGDIVIADKLGLGSATASDVPFIAVGNLFDGHAIDGLPVVGLFGADFLSSYDVIFDLPEHRINIYDIHGCKKQLPEWRGNFSKIKVEHWWRDSTKIVLHLKLNGHPIEAFLDSGAFRTLISRDDALEAGVRKSDLKQDRQGLGFGIDDEKTARFFHRFDSLELGSFRFNHPVLSVAETDNSLLGAEFLRHYQVWIPQRGDWIYAKPASAARTTPASAEPNH
ncbi:retropepsin-like aspartic protease [Kozakia baliensis]|uniref:Uncharacterized protein n=1 Tax=Kozakia baliensis TaxID=153496 RepID=A0A1D8URS7_9PROT|nr:retropepsin-like aspartic protease [Kozakia baliensis]AOX16349.1 hypothetical protein A0U89_03550 [Kozakia baliensis]GEL63586.1 hypothetical protein KBA01_08720 [Kozakia baliensis]